MTRTREWAGGGEPTLEELLNDPIIHAMMRRDGVERADVELALSRRTGRTGGGEGAEPPPRAAA